MDKNKWSRYELLMRIQLVICVYFFEATQAGIVQQCRSHSSGECLKFYFCDAVVGFCTHCSKICTIQHVKHWNKRKQTEECQEMCSDYIEEHRRKAKSLLTEASNNNMKHSDECLTNKILQLILLTFLLISVTFNVITVCYVYNQRKNKMDFLSNSNKTNCANEFSEEEQQGAVASAETENKRQRTGLNQSTSLSQNQDSTYAEVHLDYNTEGRISKRTPDTFAHETSSVEEHGLRSVATDDFKSRRATSLKRENKIKRKRREARQSKETIQMLSFTHREKTRDDVESKTTL